MRWPYFLSVAMVVIGLSLELAGCKRQEAQAAEVENNYIAPQIYLDYETGCQYVSPGGRAIYPRIAADGRTHMGCKATAPEERS